MPKISHLSSVHSRYDTRIFLKMCTSLANKGNEVYLIVADGNGDEIKNGVSILDTGLSKGRFDRIRNTTQHICAKAVSLNADLYHLHDPELIPVGLKLKRLGYRVIFDSHEDFPKQILEKPYLSKYVLWLTAKAYANYESWACARFDGVIAATPFIRDKFLSINSKAIDINNFPLLDELEHQMDWVDKRSEVCYLGGISRIRGILQVCKAMEKITTNARLNLVGCFDDSIVEQAVQDIQGWKLVNALGFLDRVSVRNILGRSIAGLVTYHPVPNHIDAQPNKMFEYMSAGIPVIASDFPLWREIIAGNDCGLLVDPLNPLAIAEAIDTLINNPEMAQYMGNNGRRAVEKKYNWDIEEHKLMGFYSRVLATV